MKREQYNEFYYQWNGFKEAFFVYYRDEKKPFAKLFWEAEHSRLKYTELYSFNCTSGILKDVSNLMDKLDEEASSIKSLARVINDISK